MCERRKCHKDTNHYAIMFLSYNVKSPSLQFKRQLIHLGLLLGDLDMEKHERNASDHASTATCL